MRFGGYNPRLTMAGPMGQHGTFDPSWGRNPGMYATGPMGPIGQPAVDPQMQQLADQAFARRQVMQKAVGENLWTDYLTGKTYKIAPYTVTRAKFRTTAGAVGFNTITTTTGKQILGTFTIPTGTEIMFAKPRFARGDVESPHIFASIRDNTSPSTEIDDGVFRVEVIDSQNHFVKFLPLEISVEKLNSASAINIDERVYFNSQTPGRAVDGDVVTLSIDNETATGDAVSGTATRVTMELIRLSTLTG